MRLLETGRRLGRGIEGWSDRRLGVALGVVVCLAYLATATYDHRQITDTVGTAVQAWTIGARGTPYLGDVPDTPWLYTFDRGTATNRLPGAVLWGVPFYVVHGVFNDPSTVASALEVSMVPAGVAGALATGLAVVFLTLGLRRLAGGVGLLGGLVVAFATPTWGVSANALWTHSVTQLGLGIAVYGAARSATPTSSLGLYVATLARPHVALIAAVAGLAEARRTRGRVTAWYAVATALSLASLGVYAWAVGGRFSPTGLYGGRLTNAAGAVGLGASESSLATMLGGFALMFVSPERGVLFFAPFVLILVPALPAAWRSAPTWVRAFAVGGCLQLLAQAAAQPIWNGGDAYFGFRLPLEAFTAAAPLLTLAAVETRRHPGRWNLLVFAVGASFVLNALGAMVLTRGVWPY